MPCSKSVKASSDSYSVSLYIHNHKDPNELDKNPFIHRFERLDQ